MHRIIQALHGTALVVLALSEFLFVRGRDPDAVQLIHSVGLLIRVLVPGVAGVVQFQRPLGTRDVVPGTAHGGVDAWLLGLAVGLLAGLHEHGRGHHAGAALYGNVFRGRRRRGTAVFEVEYVVCVGIWGISGHDRSVDTASYVMDICLF